MVEQQKKARELIEFCKPGGEFILSSGCLLGGGTPVDNLQALTDSVRRYGVYEGA